MHFTYISPIMHAFWIVPCFFLCIYRFERQSFQLLYIWPLVWEKVRLPLVIVAEKMETFTFAYLSGIEIQPMERITSVKLKKEAGMQEFIFSSTMYNVQYNCPLNNK